MSKLIPTKRLSLGHAIKLILLITLCVSGPITLGWFFYTSVRARRTDDPKYTIRTIIQTGPEREALKTIYLAELLGLSNDQPINLYRFNLSNACAQLAAFPLIKSVTIERAPPRALYVDYTVRRPVALLYNYTNTAIDEDGYLFPLEPFLTPKNLPELYLSLSDATFADDEVPWGTKLEGAEVDLALRLLKELSNSRWGEQVRLRRIDVAQAFIGSYGQREIVLSFDDRYVEIQEGRPVTYSSFRTLRLPLNNYQLALQRYLLLRSDLLAPKTAYQQAMPSVIIDLRVPQMAFLKNLPATF